MRQRSLPLDAVSVGDWLIADDGFSCLAKDALRRVQQSKTGRLYIQCEEGQHFLDGQEDDNGNLVGLTKVGKL